MINDQTFTKPPPPGRSFRLASRNIGNVYYVQYMRVLRIDRDVSPFPPSFTLLAAFILFAFRLALIMIFRVGRFE